MKKLIRIFSAFMMTATMLSLGLCAYAGQISPDSITVSNRSELNTNGYCSFICNAAALADGTNDDVNTTAEMKLFGVLPVKTVDVRITDRPTVTLGGQPFGIRLYTSGLVISKISDVPASGGNVSPAEQAGLKCGDIVMKADGEELRTNEQLLSICEKSRGEGVFLSCKRNDHAFNTTIYPAFDEEMKAYRLGLWVRDSCAGIGTITFTNAKTKSFAGLGHGIYDGESGSLMPLYDGDIVAADIFSADKSVGGRPGSLCGSFISGEPLGTLRENCECGLYGSYNGSCEGRQIEIAFRQEVKKGKAKMISTIDGTTPRSYDIEIEEISYDNNSPTKNMVVRITDPELLNKTGGIVRGMSGSPIIQNGRLAGALTHVFIDDPTHGYALFVENMTEQCNNITQKP